jgi:uncharacterized lipoprotein YddW (UPF0748 family)
VQKGFWLSYLEYYSILQNQSQRSFKAYIDEAFDNIADFGFNTVYVQVRAFGDAYYKSGLFPSGKQFSGKIGTSPGDVPYDALDVMIKSAHDRGLSIHAWVNPMRLCTDTEMKTLSDTVLYRAWYSEPAMRNTHMFKSGDYWYLNPASAPAVSLITDGIIEILRNYNIDGIQIDDYFYPSENLSLDSASYKASGTALSQSDWRITNVNTMLRQMYKAVHAANPDALFGISPQGYVQNNYAIAADVRTWCSEDGYCDYILPQVYYGFENSTAPYADVISVWSNMVKTPSVKLVIGLSPYKIGLSDTYAGSGKSEWASNTDVLARQMTLAETLPNYGGVAMYRYGSLFMPEEEVMTAVEAEVSNIERLS